MQGHFNVDLFDARGMSDEDFLKLSSELGNRELFRKIREEHQCDQHTEGKNLVFDNMAGFIFDHVFRGPAAAWPFNENDGTHSYLNFVNLSERDNDPTYEELYTHGHYAVTGHNVNSSANTSSGSKKFVTEDIMDHEVFTDPDGRESIHYRSQWLWTPSQGNASDIRSIAIWYSTNGSESMTTTTPEKASACRIRLKDAGGTPVEINKTTSQVLLVEYTFKLTSV